MAGQRFAVREAAAEDEPILARALLDAANWDGTPRFSLGDTHESRYLAGWPRPGDVGLVAETPDGTPVGAAWFR